MGPRRLLMHGTGTWSTSICCAQRCCLWGPKVPNGRRSWQICGVCVPRHLGKAHHSYLRCFSKISTKAVDSRCWRKGALRVDKVKADAKKIQRHLDVMYVIFF